jgi:hypothetical protein
MNLSANSAKEFARGQRGGILTTPDERGEHRSVEFLASDAFQQWWLP